MGHMMLMCIKIIHRNDDAVEHGQDSHCFPFCYGFDERQNKYSINGEGQAVRQIMDNHFPLETYARDGGSVLSLGEIERLRDSVMSEVA